jgi:pimeloyl-ACP methyl ester carboxylesterase
LHTTVLNTSDTLYSYIGKKNPSQPARKLLIVLQGSERNSVKRLFGYGAQASLFGYDILLINKFAYYDSTTYWRTNCFQRRLSDICTVIADVKHSIYHDSLHSILLLGSGEGGVIAPFVAQRTPGVNHVIIMGAGGLSQSKEFEILFGKGFKREKDFLAANGISTLDDLYAKFNDIRTNPDSLLGWMHYSYKYWKSYIDVSTVDLLSKSTIPVLVIAGTDGEMMPIESVKFLKEQAVGNSNIRIAMIEGADHRFIDKRGWSLLSNISKKVILPWCKEMNAF